MLSPAEYLANAEPIDTEDELDAFFGGELGDLANLSPDEIAAALDAIGIGYAYEDPVNRQFVLVPVTELMPVR